MKQKLIALGGGGHFRSCVDVIDAQGIFEIVGVVGPHSGSAAEILDFPFLGTDAELAALIPTYKNILISIGHMPHSRRRVELYVQCKELKAKFPVICSPHASVSSRAEVGEGSVIFHGALINTQAKVGVCTIVNSNALIEHNTTIGNHCHISTGALVNGGVSIGDHCFIGSGAIIRDNISIIAESVVGAGAVVVNDICEPGVYCGNPARKIDI